MSEVLLKIGNVDYTQNVQWKSYNVNEEEEYLEVWKDASQKTHKVGRRIFVKGTIEMAFIIRQAYMNFLGDIETNTTEDYVVPASVYVMNKGVIKTSNYSFKVIGKKRVVLDNAEVNIVSLEVEEQ